MANLDPPLLGNVSFWSQPGGIVPFVTHTPAAQYVCPECETATTSAFVTVTEKELPDGRKVAIDTRQAIVCAKHGVIAWLGLPRPKKKARS